MLNATFPIAVLVPSNMHNTKKSDEKEIENWRCENFTITARNRKLFLSLWLSPFLADGSRQLNESSECAREQNSK